MENTSSPAHWLEVSLTLDPELAEAVAEVLSRYVSGGVVVESGVNYNDAEDEGTPFGPARVYGYIIADEHLEETRQRLEEALWFMGRIRPLPEPVFHVIQDEDWMASWKQHYKPIPVGQHLLILPAWVEPGQKTWSGAPQRTVVRIDPSMAFGTGTHPTTQLCMEMVEKYVRPGQNVIDVGCGSGILSIAAVKVGAPYALAVDIDPASVKATQENAERNEIAWFSPSVLPEKPVEGLIEVGKGSVTEILDNQFSVRQAPVVLANILAPVIIRLFDAGLAELVSPASPEAGQETPRLILSGILDAQAPDVTAAAEKYGLTLVHKAQMGDWVALVMERK